MKILVTGHKGFIGAHMYRALLELDHEVDGYEWGDAYPNVRKYNWIIHMGAISSTTERDIDKVFRQNYDFSSTLYREARHFNINLQYSSSASVYGLNEEFKETSPVDPRNAYAWSKYLFERYVEQNPTQSIVQGFRYFNVYGDGEDHKGSQASPFSQFKKQALTNGRIKVFEGSENYRRDFIPVEKIVSTHLKFLNINESGVWNVGTGNVMSFLDIAKSFNVPIEEIPMPQQLKLSYQKYTCADLSKLNKTLGNI